MIPLEDRIQSDQRSREIRTMFDKIAGRYDFLNSVLSLNLHKKWRRLAVKLAKVSSGDRALDVCCGTGGFALELSEAVASSGSVDAVDFSESMLAIAEEKTKASGAGNIRYHTADALNLPFESDVFDCVSIGFGLRNISRPVDALGEILRVMRPGARLVCLEAYQAKNALVSLLWRVYFSRLCPVVAEMLGGDRSAYRYLPESVMEFYTIEQLSALLADIGFTGISSYELVFGSACIHVAEKELVLN